MTEQERPGAPEDDRDFVEVWQGYDPIFAEMARDALAADGIPARIRGSQNAALLGVGQYALSVSVDVPEADARRAGDLLAALFGADAEEEEEEEGEEEPPPAPTAGAVEMARPEGTADDAYRPPRRLDSGPATVAAAPRERGEPERRNRVVALALPLVVPGLAQIYARRGCAGLCILFGLGIAVIAAIYSGSMPYLGLALTFSMVVDAVMGQRAVSALARGERMPASAQWLSGWAQVLAIQVAAWLFARMLPPP